MQLLEKQLEELKANSGSQSELSKKVGALEQTVSALKSTNSGKATTTHVTNKTKEILEAVKESSSSAPPSGNIKSARWTVKTDWFYRLPGIGVGQNLVSPRFDIGGVTFTISVFPLGNRAENAGHVSVFLQNASECSTMKTALIKGKLALKVEETERPPSFSVKTISYDHETIDPRGLGQNKLLPVSDLKGAQVVTFDITLEDVRLDMRSGF